MISHRLQFHNRPMGYAAFGAVLSVVLAGVAPVWLLLVMCAILVPITAFLFHRRNSGFLLTATVLLMLIRIVWIPTELPKDGALMSFLNNLRNGLKSSADLLFRDEAATAKGMLLGDVSGLNEQQYTRFSEAGLLHLFAISGLHVTLLTGTLGKLVRTRNRALSLTMLTLFLLFFCAVTEFSSSVLRASFMLIAIRLSRMRERQVDMPSVFCFALAMTLLCEPFSLYRVGFQLSFAAAGGLILLGDAFRKPFRKVMPNSKIITALTSSTAAIVGMLPVMAAHFGELAWVSIPFSILLIPTMPVILLFGFASVIFYGVFPHVATILSYPAYGAIKLLTLATNLLDVPLLRIPGPHPIVIILYYVSLILCSKLYLRNAKHPPWIGLGLLMTTIVLWFIM